MEAYHRNTIESIQGVELWERHQVQLATLRGCATGCQRYTRRNVVALAAVARGFARLSCFTCVLGSWSGVMCMPLS